jgi:hypothetical protein
MTMHILGVSSLAAGHKTLVPQIEELKKYGRRYHGCSRRGNSGARLSIFYLTL